MCGFLGVFSNEKQVLDHFERHSQDLMRLVARRGPSEVKNTRAEKYFISHALLAINDYVPQPIEDDDHLVFMNGEIYNQSALDKRNDTEWILDFVKNGEPLSSLDGEYIIAFMNKQKNTITIASDPFATKPCFYFLAHGVLALCSYQEPLIRCFGNTGIHEFPPNFRMTIDLNNFFVIESCENIAWDFTPKYNDFDKWNLSFENSILKRTSTDKKVFLGLSSGYDSGLIVSELIRLQRSFDSFSIIGAEDKDTLMKRIEIINNSSIGSAHLVQYDQGRYDKHLRFIKENSSNYPYSSTQGKFIKWMLDDKAAVGLSMICEDAKRVSAPIYFSGQGADEIFSDYATRGPHHGTIRGDYTGVRSKWINFDMGFQRNFLSKEERIPGAWGIEARYPFLDRHVVQNFLWLNDKLKNAEYKQCLAQRMRQHNFPFKENEKCGFNPIKSLPGQKLYK